MRVVITGAAGFLGTRVVELLVEAGHDVRAVGDVPDHVEFGDEVTVVRGDLRDPDLAERAVAGAEVVCHLAGCHPGELASDQFPAVIAELDVPTGVILHALAATGFEGRVVLGSNAEVYGEGRYDCALHGSLRIGRRAAADLAARQWSRPVLTVTVP
ncbi:MAG: NAD(P)-dependent oxidoreductase [Ilumatobacteraceae bacterium]